MNPPDAIVLTARPRVMLGKLVTGQFVLPHNGDWVVMRSLERLGFAEKRDMRYYPTEDGRVFYREIGK